MSSEIPKPNLKDPMSWATISRVRTQWLRKVSPQFGLDTSKMVLGDVLSTIIGDDANCFGYIFIPESANWSRSALLERLDWEITVPELPQNIRSKLEQVRLEVSSLNWTNKKDFFKARSIWVKEAEKFTQKQIALNRGLREAISYDLKNSLAVSDAWSEFIYGKK